MEAQRLGHAAQLIAGAHLRLEPITGSDVFIALVTAEGLLFAALSISATLAGSSEFGARVVGPPWLLSVLAALLLGAVAVAAVFSWSETFAGRAWSHSVDRDIEAFGLLCAIVSQPLIAILIAAGLARG